MLQKKKDQIEKFLEIAGDNVWNAQQIYRKSGETRLAEICQETIDRILALRLVTITIKKRSKNDKQNLATREYRGVGYAF